MNFPYTSDLRQSAALAVASTTIALVGVKAPTRFAVLTVATSSLVVMQITQTAPAVIGVAALLLGFTLAAAFGKAGNVGLALLAALLGWLRFKQNILTNANNELLILLALTSWAGVSSTRHALVSHDHVSSRRAGPMLRVAMGAFGLIVALLLADRVMLGYIESGDELAFRFQAGLFASGHATGPCMPCPTATQLSWVYCHNGHTATQYPMGWPLMMAPFSLVGRPWAAAPAYHAATAYLVGLIVERLDGRKRIWVFAIGWLSFFFAPFALVQGLSSYSHTGTCFAVALAIYALCTSARSSSAMLLAFAVGLGFMVRNADGAILGFPALLLLLKLRWPARNRRGLVSAGVILVAWAALGLLFNHSQMDSWWTSGYALARLYHPNSTGSQLSFVEPGADSLAFVLPVGVLSTWALPNVLGWCVAGWRLHSVKRYQLVLCAGPLALCCFYAFLPWVRGPGGYGPRYHSALMVPLSLGFAMFVASLRSTLLRSLSLGALGYLVVLQLHDTLRYAHGEVREFRVPLTIVEQSQLRDLIVVVPDDLARQHAISSYEQAQNTSSQPTADEPFWVKPHPDEASAVACARRAFPTRTAVRVEPHGLVPVGLE